MSRKSLLGIAAAFVILVALPAITFLFLKQGEKQRTNRTVPRFTLLTSKGDSLYSSEFKESVYVAEFTFTRCRSQVCEKLDSTMRSLQDRFGGHERFRMLTISFDTENDRPEILEGFARNREASGIWHHATGDQQTVIDLILGGFFAKPEHASGEISKMKADRKIVVIDREGKIHGYYDVLMKKKVDLLFETVESLVDDA